MEQYENVINDMELQDIRRYHYEDHKKRMLIVNDNMKKCRRYNVLFNIVVGALSIAAVYLWVSFTQAGIKMSLTLEEEIGTIHFPGFAITALTAFPIAIMTQIADIFLIKQLNRICQLIYGAIIILSIGDIFFKYGPMEITHIAVLVIYAAVGIWAQDLATRNYKEIRYLSAQEGYPDFNFGLDEHKVNKYTRYRERWLKREKQLDYFTENEKPITDYVSTAATSTSMEGISVDEEKRDGWFENKSETKNASADMEDLQTEGAGIVDESEYIIEDVRHKPL